MAYNFYHSPSAAYPYSGFAADDPQAFATHDEPSQDDAQPDLYQQQAAAAAAVAAAAVNAPSSAAFNGFDSSYDYLPNAFLSQTPQNSQQTSSSSLNNLSEPHASSANISHIAARQSFDASALAPNGGDLTTSEIHPPQLPPQSYPHAVHHVRQPAPPPLSLSQTSPSQSLQHSHPSLQISAQHPPPTSPTVDDAGLLDDITPVESSFPAGVPYSMQDGEANDNTLEGGEQRSSSEDKEPMTPAQTRRKAQNRAAQRAFRERKERHVKDLETKLHTLSAHSSTLLTDNERLKRELQQLASQNEILRASTAAAQRKQQQQHPHVTISARDASPVHGPQSYTPTDFQQAVGVDPERYPWSHENYSNGHGRRLAAGATWDLIQSHELFRRGQLDIADVCRRLKGRAACDGRGPTFSEADVLRAIEESVISGSDELI